MKKTFLSIIILFFSTINTNISAHVSHYDNFNSLKYELFRNNKLIGFHNYNFKRLKDILVVKSNVEFSIIKLGINLYDYKANSEEIYKNNKFSKFTSTTIQNKKKKFVNIKFDDKSNQLIIDGSSYKGAVSKDFIVGTWWNHEIIKAKSQVSAISGRVIEQKITFIGKEKIKIGNKNYNTLRFNFSSSDLSLPPEKKLNTDIWYEENTYLWVKAAFDKTGYWEYRLKTSN